MVVTTDDDVDDDDAMVDKDAIDAIDNRRAEDGVAPFDCLRDFDLERGDGDDPEAGTMTLSTLPLPLSTNTLANTEGLQGDEDDVETPP